MQFMEQTIAHSLEVWKRCAETRFVRAMGEDTLDREMFLDYIVQDSIYLRDYLKVFAYAITKSDTLRDMQLYYQLLGYVNDGENVTRLNYLKDLGITDAQVDQMAKRGPCADYCRFLVETAARGTQEDILMAMLPCMLGYRYVFEELKKRAPQVMDGYYGPLVADYTSEGYEACCKFWTEIAQEKCGGLDPERQKELEEVFYQASLHELYFWQMAGGER